YYRIFRIDTIGEKERQIWREIIDMHPPAQVILHVSKPVGKCKCQLCDRICPGLGNMVTRNRNRIKIADLFIDKILLNITHHPQRKFRGEYARILRLVLFQYIRLHRPSNSGNSMCFYFFVNIGGEDLVASEAEEHKTESVIAWG